VTGEALSGGALTFSISVPKTADFRSVALGASGLLQLGAADQVVTDTGGFARVTNTGTVLSDLATGTKTGDVESVSRVALHDNVHVVGDVVTAAGLTSSASATVTGNSAQQSLTLQPVTSFSWSVTFPPASNSLIAYPGTTQSASPGAYGGLFVYPNATLKLTSGVYYLDQFDTEEQGTLALDTTNGPVIVYVRTSVVYRGATTINGPADRLFIALAGTAPVTIESNFSGVLIAPNAPIRLGIVGKQDSGSIFAQQIQVDPNVNFQLHPFAFWSTVVPQAPSLQDCANHVPVRADLTGKDREVALQTDLARYCSMPGADACSVTIAARTNVDYATIAFSLFAETATPATYLAVVRDRSRKENAAHDDPVLAALICGTGDQDGDLVPDSRDVCPNTPPLTPTFDNGCTDPTVPLAPSAADVSQLFAAEGNTLIDPRCANAAVLPDSVAGAFYRSDQPNLGTYILAGRVTNQPAGCSVWYVFDIEELPSTGVGRRYQVAFGPQEESLALVGLSTPVPPGYIQFNSLPGDLGTRGFLGSVGGHVGVRFRVRVMNGGGQKSDWSAWKITTLADCIHLGFSCGG